MNIFVGTPYALDHIIGCYEDHVLSHKTYIQLDGDPATIRNLVKNSTHRSRNGKSAVEAL